MNASEPRESAHWHLRPAAPRLPVSQRPPMGAHRAVRGGADGTCPIFMPPLAAGGLSRPADRAGGGHRRALDIPKIVLEGYPPPRDPRPGAAAGDARSGRDRGEHPPGLHWNELVEHTPSSCTNAAFEVHLCAEKFASTAATPAPAAATTSCSAAPACRFAPSCAVPGLLSA